MYFIKKVNKITRKKYLKFFFVLSILLLVKNFFERLNFLSKKSNQNRNIKNTYQCQPLDLNHYKNFDKLIQKTEKLKHPICPDKDWVIIDLDGTFSYNKNYLLSKNLSIDYCEYRSVSWINDFEYGFKNIIRIKPGEKVNLNEQFFHIICKSSNLTYWAAFARIFKKDSSFDKKNSRIKQNQPINVFFLGLDSVSREKWLTRLPKSSQYLIDKLGVKILNGYNIVGDGTPAAIIPLLTSKHEHELPKTEKKSQNSSFVDGVYPLIWTNFTEKLNYATMYNEDWPQVGNIKNF